MADKSTLSNRLNLLYQLQFGNLL